MEQKIVFYMKIKKLLGGFALASNFIYKLENGLEISLSDVTGIVTSQFDFKGTSGLLGNRNLVEWVAAKGDGFREIKKPDRLHTGHEHIYCIEVNEEDIDDVVELQYYYLVKNYFKQSDIVLFLRGSQNLYHRASHYFYSISKQNQEFYDSVFYLIEDGSPIRLQLKNIGALTGFFPLQMVDDQRILFLTQKVGALLSEEDFKHMITSEYQEIYTKVTLEIRGCIACWNSLSKLFDTKKMGSLYRQMSSYTVLTFLLVSYSLKYIKASKESDSIDWESYIKLLREYAMGVQQLLENIVQHSTGKEGAISIRLHKNENKYLQVEYGNNLIHKTPYLEISVTDYDALNDKGNIADTFKSRLAADLDSKTFEFLQPIDFFKDRQEQKNEREQCVLKAFDEYYFQKENYGKHYGLRIFMGMIKKNEGVFACYSHNCHEKREGEEYQLSAKNSVANLQIPGTGYRILLPLNESYVEIKRADTNIETLVDIDQNIKKYLNECACFDKYLDINGGSVRTREEKLRMIHQLSQNFRDYLNEKQRKKTIYYINASKLQEEYGEYICKAMLLAEIEGDLPDYVFYECEEGFAEAFRNSMRVHYERYIGQSIRKNDYTIVIYTAGQMHGTVICPGNYRRAFLLNRISCFARGNFYDLSWLGSEHIGQYPDAGEIEQIPYDILFPVSYNGTKKTIFENYVWEVLETDIQDRSFGCKISETHMRLGSTIHIDTFYEAELLFSNKLFIYRFAFLLVKQMEEEITGFSDIKKLTLYSYALYSELYIFEIINILTRLHPAMDIDYIILEREAEHRDYSHTDRIRYSHNFSAEEEKNVYFSDRKIILVVPITSTLKTHTKLIHLFQKENTSFKCEQIIRNYAIILVGSKDKNQYWELDETDRTIKNCFKHNQDETDILQVKYMVEVKVDYQEALGCKMCFPDKPLNEKPLIEVNAASTIPNQAFGLYKDSAECTYGYSFLEDEEKKLQVLEESLIYSHTKRGENHYLFYFKTDVLFVSHKKEIQDWLLHLPVHVKTEEYHILFSPAHFSNAGFLEYINKFVFHDAALIIRADIDKEYRNNLAAKYSNLGVLLDYLEQDSSEKKMVRIYYVDDSIITGRTFFRAKSMISTLLEGRRRIYENVEVRLFDKIFVLLDRNSHQSKRQYLYNGIDDDAVKNHFFAYLELNISSLRNHGDSCVVCQLKSDAEKLYEMSATRPMAEHWDESKEKFEVKHLESKLSENKFEQIQRIPKNGRTQPVHNAFRRMYCTHIAGSVINEKYHGNHKGRALESILHLLLTDYKGRITMSTRETALEYFFSYLKVMSRPFIVFNKSLKEAVFDLLLILSEFLINQEEGTQVILERADTKKYLLEYKEKFHELRHEIIEEMLHASEKRNLLLILIKQLTELKSNYFIRIESIVKIQHFISDFQEESKADFYERYLRSVKKLLEINSDTSKSAWFNIEITRAIYERKVMFPDNILDRLVIENIRSYYSGIMRLSDSIAFTKEERKHLFGSNYINAEEYNENMQVDGSDEEIMNEVQERILSQIKDISYRDFEGTLKADAAFENKDLLLKEEYILGIAANIQLMKDIQNQSKKEKSEKILAICKKIAVLFRIILNALQIQLMIEVPMGCELWERRLKIKYNELVTRYGEANEELFLDTDVRNDYLIISESSGARQGGSYVKAEVIERLQKYRKQNIEQGFLIERNKNYLIWELGQRTEHQILIYAEFNDLNNECSIKNIRNMMMNYSLLNRNIFNKKNRDYLHELLVAGKDVLVYNQEKAHSHTKSNTQAAQYSDVRNPEKYKWAYRSHVLTLLADLKVSDIYRQSLKDEYYDRQNLECKSVDCSKIFENYNDEAEFTAIMTHAGKHVFLSIVKDETSTCFQNDTCIGEAEKVVALDIVNGNSDLQFLIHALVLNAAMVERGISKEEERYGEKVFVRYVYLSKTSEGNLRIANMIRKTDIDTKKINRALKYPPRDEDQGISLWSFSRQLRVYKNIYMRKYIEKVEKDIADLPNSEDILWKTRKKVEEYLDDNTFDIRCGICREQKGNTEEYYFYTEVPIFEERYLNFFKME